MIVASQSTIDTMASDIPASMVERVLAEATVMALPHALRLAVLLDEAYDESYHTDREQGMREFGSKYKEELQGLVESGHTLKELARKANVDDVDYWARFIRDGME